VVIYPNNTQLLARVLVVPTIHSIKLRVNKDSNITQFVSCSM